MDVALASELMSGDIRVVEMAVEMLYPIDKMKKGRTRLPWMHGLTNAQRRQVITLLAEATQQSSDELRALFLRAHLGPDIAWEILHTTTPEQRIAIAKRCNLYHDVVARNLPWQKGTSAIQRRAVLQRMMIYGVKNQQYCYELLKKAKAPSRYGLTMLRANDDEFMDIILRLKRKRNYSA
ncbi:hypothetical protein CBS101457_000091 [Exobasidium rhododendri]|nr:hypothetical protein CBS101457_000091 [Exobasidium rhododendri]